MSYPLFPIVAQASEPNVFTYFADSNLAGQVIVVLLILFSLIAWTVMIGKFLDLERMRVMNLAVERRLQQARSVFETAPPVSESGPYAHLLRSVMESIERLRGSEEIQPSVRTQIGHVENALQRAVSRQCVRYESKMVLLGSIVTGAPFMGLLGTVWGVMDSFGSIALKSSASLQALAPGVSGALLTTVAGLLVAIPSVFGYNYLLTQTKIMVTELENFASSLADRVELELREYYARQESD